MDEPQEKEKGDRREGDDDIRPSVPPPRRVAVSRAPDAAWDALPPPPEPTDDRVRWSFFPFLVQAALAVFFVWLYCQLLPAVRWVMSCEGWRFYAALGAVLVPVIVLAWVVLRALLLFRRLPPIAQLTEAGIPHTWRTAPGGHTWDFWEQEIRYTVLEWMSGKRESGGPEEKKERLDF